jgi:hypothetical protein
MIIFSRRELLVLPSLLVALLYLWLHWNARQPYDGDSMFFLPNSAYFALGKGLINPCYELAVGYSEQGDGRLVWHGFSGWMIVGWLAPSSDYRGVIKVIAAMGAISIILFTSAVAVVISKFKFPNWHKIGLSLPTPFCIAALLNNNGRPEAILIFLLSLAIFCEVLIRRRIAIGLIHGIIFAFSITTSPIAAGISGLAYLIYLLAKFDKKNIFIRIFTGLIGGGITLVALFYFYPYTLGELFHGLSQHSNVVRNFASSRHFYYWFLAIPLLGFTFLTGLLLTCITLYKIKNSLQGKICFILLIALMVLVMYFAPDSRVYNVYGLILCVPLLIISVQREDWNDLVRFFHILFSMILFIPMALPFLLMCIVAIKSPSDVSLDKLNSVIALYQCRGTVAVSSGLFAAVDIQKPPVKIIRSDAGLDAVMQSNADYFFLQQINPLKLTPPLIRGYTLVHDSYSTRSFSILGLKKIQTARDYSYALYQREN